MALRSEFDCQIGTYGVFMPTDSYRSTDKSLPTGLTSSISESILFSAIIFVSDSPERPTTAIIPIAIATDIPIIAPLFNN